MLQSKNRNLSEFICNHYIWWAFVLVILITLFNIGCFLQESGSLFYTDSDCYTRALRIIDWLKDFQWAEKLFPYFNPPYGFELHFTRICDVIWLALATPFMLFLPLKEAVFYGGMVFSPLFMALALAVVLWGLKPYLPKMKNQHITFIIFSLTALCLFDKLSDIFNFSRPDHHSLMCFIVCCALAMILRNQIRQKPKSLFWLGVLCGCGLWASSALEGLFVVAIVLSVLAVNRIFYRHSALELLYYAIGLFLCVMFAWIINPPLNGWLAVDINRLSIVHVVLTALMVSAFWALTWFRDENRLWQICYFGIAAMVCALLMLLIFGSERLFVSVYNPEVYKVFIQEIDEMQHQTFWDYATPSFVFGALIMGYLIYISRGRQAYVVQLLIFFAVITTAALIYRRFYQYYIAIFVVLYGIGLFLLMFAAAKSEKGKLGALLYVLFPVFYLNAFYPAPQKTEFPPLKANALVYIFKAPELMFYQGVDTVGGPYHTNVEGIVDNRLIWTSEDEEEVKNLLKKHQVRSIYLSDCKNCEAEKHTHQLFGQVISGQNLYPWLNKIGDGHYEIDYTKF